MIIIGIDLALPGRIRTGVAILEKNFINIFTIDSKYILNILSRYVINNDVIYIGIDSPLSKPRYGINRLIEVKARTLGLKLLPPGLDSMLRLTEYAIKITNELSKYSNVKIFEVHPSSSLRILNTNRNTIINIINSVFKLSRSKLNEHEVDAVVSLLTVYCYINGFGFEIYDEDPKEFLILPKKSCIEKCLKREKL